MIHKLLLIFHLIDFVTIFKCANTVTLIVTRFEYDLISRQSANNNATIGLLS